MKAAKNADVDGADIPLEDLDINTSIAACQIIRALPTMKMGSKLDNRFQR